MRSTSQNIPAWSLSAWAEGLLHAGRRQLLGPEAVTGYPSRPRRSGRSGRPKEAEPENG